MKYLFLLMPLLLLGCKAECNCFGDVDNDSLKSRLCSSVQERVADSIEEYTLLTEYVVEKDREGNNKLWVWFEIMAKEADPAVGYGYFYESTNMTSQANIFFVDKRPMTVLFSYPVEDVKFKLVNIGNYISEGELFNDNVPQGIWVLNKAYLMKGEAK